MNNIHKTYKNYIGGSYVRGESGRIHSIHKINVPVSSRKDVREAVEANHKVLSNWANRSAYNKTQIIYRLAEMIPDSSVFNSPEVIDVIIRNAGWTDKYQQILSSVNPVEGSFFNYSSPKEIGVLATFSEHGNLPGFINRILLAVLTGNVTTVIVDLKDPLLEKKLDFAEIINNADFPAGVINILSGNHSELLPVVAAHKNIHGIDFTSINVNPEDKKTSLDTMKRIITCDEGEIILSTPFIISSFVEIKTVWSPVTID